jgi:hypothetical protein
VMRRAGHGAKLVPRARHAEVHCFEERDMGANEGCWLFCETRGIPERYLWVAMISPVSSHLEISKITKLSYSAAKGGAAWPR